MRSLCLIIILFAFFAPIKSYATEQIPNYLIYNGKQYPLEIDPLYPYLAKAKKWDWTGENDGYWCSALGRGYYAAFEIVGNELRLKDVRNCSESLLKKFLSAFNVKGSIFKLDWFTDSIVIGKDEPLYNDIHEYYSVLHFEKGILFKETRMGYKEYLSNRLKLVLNYDNTDSLLRKVYEYEHQRDLDIIEHYLESRKKDKSEFLAKLKTKYEKRFGKSMSDFELKIQKIEFKNKYTIRRTLYGAREDSEYLNVTKLNIEDWLDIIRALYTCCLDKWELVPKYDYYYLREETLYIYFSKGSLYDERYEFPIKSGQLTNLEEFQKVMDDIVAKIRKNSAKP
jgi:hypothetical protein